MKVQEFLSVLNQNKNKELLFEYEEGHFAGTNYHLTEVKNISFETVDCGGSSNAWKETHVQLWESPDEIGKQGYLTTDKALSILERVDGIRPLWLDTEVKIEFGNARFHTAVMAVEKFNSAEERLTIKLFTEEPQCKAQEVCGALVEELASTEEDACSSGSGCC